MASASKELHLEAAELCGSHHIIKNSCRKTGHVTRRVRLHLILTITFQMLIGHWERVPAWGILPHLVTLTLHNRYGISNSMAR